MPTEPTDLIPDDFGTSEVTPPVSFLRFQASSLEKKTRGQIEGRVTTHAEGDVFTHFFALLVQPLDGYTYSVFSVKHPIDYYPLLLEDHLRGKQFRCSSEEEYLTILRQIFSSDQFKRVVASLMSQVMETRNP